MYPILETSNQLLDNITETIKSLTKPVVFRNLVSSWPSVIKARQSTEAIANYLVSKCITLPLTVFIGDAKENGRIFYNEDYSEFNFKRLSAPIDEIIEKILYYKTAENSPSIYVGSTDIDFYFPDFKHENWIPVNSLSPISSLWFGNKTRVAAHYDVPNNIACVVSGIRKFILFPPEQLKNLYIGSIDIEMNPGGQPISLVDINNPDYDKFPNFKEAITTAIWAELKPGDAIFIPSMWWHHVESMGDFNVLVNYWWRDNPSYLGSPTDAFLHSLMSIGTLSMEEKSAWKNIYDYYIFNSQNNNMQHIPENIKGCLSGFDKIKAKKLRSNIANKFSRDI